MQPASASPVPEAAAPRSLFSVMLDIFFEPKAAFRDILAAPRVWFPITLLSIAAILFVYLFAQHVGWERFMRKAFEANERAMAMPADQREQAIAMQVKISSVAGYIMPPVFIVAAGAISGAVLMFIFNNLMGAAVKFKQAFAIVAWSGIPTLLSTAAATAVLFLKSPEDFDLQNPLGLNIGFYLPSSTAKWLASVATSFDLFSFWSIALIAAGFSVATRKSWTSCLVATLVPWLAYVLLKAGWAAMFG